MVTLKDAKIQAVPFEDIAPGAKLVSPNHELVLAARACGICLGDE